MKNETYTIDELLEGEIYRQLADTSLEEVGTSKMEKCVDTINILYGLKLKEDDQKEKMERLNQEIKLKEKELELKEKELEQIRKEELKWKKIEVGLTAFGGLTTLIFYSTWMERGFEFEKSGAFTSNTFKGLIREFKAKFKK